jgi:acetate kinase
VREDRDRPPLLRRGAAGIGEHPVEVRARVGRDAAWLGIVLDEAANRRGGPRISVEGQGPSVWVIATDEELMIARQALRLIPALVPPIGPSRRPTTSSI